MVQVSRWPTVRALLMQRLLRPEYEVWWLEWWDGSGQERHGPAVKVGDAVSVAEARRVALAAAPRLAEQYGPGVAVILDRQGRRVDEPAEVMA